MGQLECTYFSRHTDTESTSKAGETFKHCFSEGKTLVLDYSNLFHSAHSLAELKSKVRHIYPCSIKCLFDRQNDECHSYVTLVAMHLSRQRMEYIGFEIRFKKERQLILSIFPHRHQKLTENIHGVLEMSYEFAYDNSRFERSLEEFIDWITEQGEFNNTPGKDGDVGKEIYYFLKHLQPS